MAAKDKMEKQMIIRALKTTGGNVSRASKLMGMASPQALHYKLKKHGIDRKAFWE